ncbi:MAG: L-2-amino-thiazoline-4-carboxylic acid hydrolase, partial [bacterium]|nr:L-2-amino-thiazoline-4-carboxylic acid hydrolase [bacterium]
IIKDTNSIIEIKVTECLYATGFKELNADDIGNATECWAYHMMLEEFNPKIKLTRDKSLMLGDDHCLYRLVMTE